MKEDVPEGYKRCSKCGEVKPISEFGKRNNRKSGIKPECLVCSRKQRKVYCETHKDSEKKYRQKRYINKKDILLDKSRRYHICVKNPSCPAVGRLGARFVILTCPICGKEFRKRETDYNYRYEIHGQTAFYCSRECSSEAQRKSHKSEYEKKITRIRKEQRL